MEDQLRVQLAGCLTAAEGYISGKNRATKEMYGWSPAYQAVLELRESFELLAFEVFTLFRIDPDRLDRWLTDGGF